MFVALTWISSIACVLSCVVAHASTELSFNAGEFLEKVTLSKLLGNSSSGWFLPFHFTFSSDISDDFQISVDAIYRRDNHGTFSDYQEYLLLAGAGFRFGSGWIASLKAGGGNAAGTLAYAFLGTDGKIISGRYSCSEWAVQSSIQKRDTLSDKWESGFGGGVLLVIPRECQNEIEFSMIGRLVHRTIPILIWDLIYRF